MAYTNYELIVSLRGHCPINLYLAYGVFNGVYGIME